jgi:hypothetical protein
MAAPVWVLSVDLQTKTATFQTGLADAAKAARGSFQDIKAAAKEMGDGVGEASSNTEYSMMHARHGVMLLGEEFGVHLPRGITAFIVSLGPVGAAMEAAFPFLAIILGATLLIEHLTKAGDAADKLAESGHKLGDQMAEGINKADMEIVNASIEIRKLAGDPAWDLLARKMELKDAEKGMENVHRLEQSIVELLKAAAPTSNWNPFNWGDNSGEVQAKAKSLQEETRGKSQTEQAVILSAASAIQGKILEQMKGQTDVSGAQLANQQKYVDFLKQETELLQKQADAAVLADQASQGKDREARIKKAEEEQNKLAEVQQRGLEHRMQIEREYDKKRDEALNKGMEEAVKEGELEAQATAAVNKSILEAEKERLRIVEELGKEEAEHERKMAALGLHAEQDAAKESIKLHRNRSQEILAEQTSAENAEYAAQMHAYQIELAALDKYGKDYEVKLKQIQDKEAELTKAHENNVTEIENKALTDRLALEATAAHKMEDLWASGLMKVLSGHESFAKMVRSIGNEVASGMMENAIKSMLALDMTKEKQAGAAARDAYLAGMKFPWPVNIVMAPTLAALAFSSMMAFEEGGIVPGVERGDVVPARLTPGEAILPKQLTENLTRASQGGSSGSGDVHVHVHQTNHLHAIDGDGVGQMLEKHADTFSRHLEGQLRKMNR